MHVIFFYTSSLSKANKITPNYQLKAELQNYISLLMKTNINQAI